MEFFGEKLVIKMWDSIIDRGVGGLLGPWQTKRMGQAETEVRKNELLMIADTENQIAIARKRTTPLFYTAIKQIGSNGEAELLRSNFDVLPNIDLGAVIKSVERADALEKVQGEINISRALLIAEKELLFDESDVPVESIEDDWLRNWRDSTMKVSSEKLQTMWGKILAGEVKNPGTYSLRVLELLKSLSESEAKTISLVAKYLVQNNLHRDHLPYIDKVGLNLGVLLELQSIGILVGVDSESLGIEYESQRENEYLSYLRCNNKSIQVSHEDQSKKLSFQVISVTGAGQMLIGLGEFEADTKYLLQFSRKLIGDGYKVSMGDCQKVDAKQYRVSNLTSVEA